MCEASWVCGGRQKQLLYDKYTHKFRTLDLV